MAAFHVKPGRKPQPVRHGTDSGYQAHVKRGQLACGACLAAHSYKEFRHRQRGRCAAGLGWPLLGEGEFR